MLCAFAILTMVSFSNKIGTSGLSLLKIKCLHNLKMSMYADDNKVIAESGSELKKGHYEHLRIV